MTKEQFIRRVAENTGFTLKDTKTLVEEALSTIQEVLTENDFVQFVGFGKFEVSHRKPRVGVNPQTKERITIPASKLPVFRAGKDLKDAVNE